MLDVKPATTRTKVNNLSIAQHSHVNGKQQPRRHEDAKGNKTNSSSRLRAFAVNLILLGVSASWRFYFFATGAVLAPLGTLPAATSFHTDPRPLSKGFQVPYWLVALVT